MQRRWTLAFACAVSLAAAAGDALAQAPSAELTPDQKGYIVYDRCMMQAAIKASHTDAEDEEIFGLAKRDCAAVRAAVVVGQEHNTEFLTALDAADADKATNFPAWIKGVRERRILREQQGPKPTNAPNN